LNRGASIKATDTGRQTALHLAASAGHEEAVKFLLKSGADKNARDSTDSIPARSAKIFGHPGLANMMERNLL
jgi:glutaminase